MISPTPWQVLTVNNPPTTYTGTIPANGSLSRITGLPNIVVYLFIKPGTCYGAGTMPGTPDPASTQVTCDIHGVWQCANIPGAACMPGMGAPNQLLMWAYVNGGYNPTLVNFIGQPTN